MDFSSRNKVKAEWGMASMTDLIFLLLIFFIIMSLMSNNQTPIDFPKASESTMSKEINEDARVIITENNQYILSQGDKTENPMEFDQIKPLIEASVVKSGKPKLIIDGNEKSDYEAVFRVFEFAQSKGWDPVINAIGKLKNPEIKIHLKNIENIVSSTVVKSGKQKLRIAAHRNADYESVLHLLALAQANGWDPVLSYDK